MKVCIQPGRQGGALQLIGCHGRQLGVQARELDFAAKAQRPGGHQRAQSDRQRVDASAGDRVPAAASGDAARDLDAKLFECALQQATAIQRVRSKVEGKPPLLAGGGAAARRGGSLDEHDLDTAAGQEGCTEQARQAPADDDDWGFVIGHTSITIRDPGTLHAR
jgi:hypothetical protein